MLAQWKIFFFGPEHDEHIVHLPPDWGKGYNYKGNQFVHHTSLHHFETAFFNLVRHQKIVLFGVILFFIGALFFDWHLTLVIFFSTATIIYFLGFLFDAFVVYRTFRFRPEIHVLPSEMEAIHDYEWPTYTIFCPLYKEWQVVPQFMDAMQKLDGENLLYFKEYGITWIQK